MDLHYLVHFNASFNLISAVFLVIGFRLIRRGDKEKHKKAMLGALTSSILFLIS